MTPRSAAMTTASPALRRHSVIFLRPDLHLPLKHMHFDICATAAKIAESGAKVHHTSCGVSTANHVPHAGRRPLASHG